MLKEINVTELKENVFHKIGKEWMLISAGDEQGSNAMTASWGGMGVLWNKNAVYIFVRPQRYTKQLLDHHTHFSLTFFSEEHRSMLSYMGKASGKDEDKIATAKLHVCYDKAPYFEEAKEVFLCRKLFVQELDPACFIDKDVDAMNYPQHDYHLMYVGEIEKVLISKEA